MSSPESFMPVSPSHDRDQQEAPPAPPPRYSGFRNPSTPHGLGATRRPGTASSTAPLPSLPSDAARSPPSDKALPPAPPDLPSPTTQAAPSQPAEPSRPEPAPEIFPQNLPPRPAQTRTRWTNLPLRFYVSPRPRQNEDIELGTLPGRRIPVDGRAREDMVSPEPARGNSGSWRGTRARYRENLWGSVFCSVRGVLAFLFVAAFWTCMMLVGSGFLKTKTAV